MGKLIYDGEILGEGDIEVSVSRDSETKLVTINLGIAVIVIPERKAEILAGILSEMMIDDGDVM